MFFALLFFFPRWGVKAQTELKAKQKEEREKLQRAAEKAEAEEHVHTRLQLSQASAPTGRDMKEREYAYGDERVKTKRPGTIHRDVTTYRLFSELLSVLLFLFL